MIMKPLFFLLITTGFLLPIDSKANELNIDGLSDYSSYEVEPNNFSNVIPGDWAFTALNELAKNRNCNVFNRRSDKVSSRKIFTRYEAALIIQTCLKNVQKISQQERRLLNEFTLELNSLSLHEVKENE